jgi:hypothetical protein
MYTKGGYCRYVFHGPTRPLPRERGTGAGIGPIRSWDNTIFRVPEMIRLLVDRSDHFFLVDYVAVDFTDIIIIIIIMTRRAAVHDNQHTMLDRMQLTMS